MKTVNIIFKKTVSLLKTVIDWVIRGGKYSIVLYINY